MIKRLLILLVIFLGLHSSSLFAQRIIGEAILGLNMTKVEGDLVNNGSFKFQKQGINIGVGAIIPFNDMFSINIEMLFAQKGAYKKYGPHPDSAKPYYKTKLDYAEVPLLFSYHDKKGLIISTGFSYSRLVRVNWIVNGRTLSNSLSDGYYSTDNIDWIADFKYRVWKSMHINIRYQWGLTTIWSGHDEDLLTTREGRTQSTDQRNSVLSFRLVWLFGEKQSKDIREGIE